MTNCVLPPLTCGGSCSLANCTVLGTAKLNDDKPKDPPNAVVDCIFPALEVVRQDTRIENSIIIGPGSQDMAKRGKNCILAAPAFRNSTLFDFQLAKGSPGVGKATDGGNIGVRYTPQMIELLDIALKLRAGGAIKF